MEHTVCDRGAGGVANGGLDRHSPFDLCPPSPPSLPSGSVTPPERFKALMRGLENRLAVMDASLCRGAPPASLVSDRYDMT